MGAMELQIFVSLLVVLGAAFVALICDFLKGNNEKLREFNIELITRQEERERSSASAPQTRRSPQPQALRAAEPVRTAESPLKAVPVQAPAVTLSEGIPAVPRRRRAARDMGTGETVEMALATPAPVQVDAIAAMEDWARRVVEQNAAGRKMEPVSPAVEAQPEMACAMPAVAGDTEPVQAGLLADGAIQPMPVAAAGCGIEAEPLAAYAGEVSDLPEAVAEIGTDLQFVEMARIEAGPVRIGTEPRSIDVEPSGASGAVLFNELACAERPAGEFTPQMAALVPLPENSMPVASGYAPLMPEPAPAAPGFMRVSGSSPREQRVQGEEALPLAEMAALPLAAAEAAKRAVEPGVVPLEAPTAAGGARMPQAAGCGSVGTPQMATPQLLPVSTPAAAIEMAALGGEATASRVEAVDVEFSLESGMRIQPPDWTVGQEGAAAPAVAAQEPAIEDGEICLDHLAGEFVDAPSAFEQEAAAGPSPDEVVRVRVLDESDLLQPCSLVDLPVAPVAAARSLIEPARYGWEATLAGPETGGYATAAPADCAGGEIPVAGFAATQADAVRAGSRLPVVVPAPALLEEQAAALPRAGLGQQVELDFEAIAAEAAVADVEPVLLDEEDEAFFPAAPPVGFEIEPVDDAGYHFIEVDNEPEMSAKVVQMPLPAQATFEPPARAALRIPRGIQDRAVFDELISKADYFNGVVFLVGVMGFEHLVAEHGHPAVAQAVGEATSYFDGLLNNDGFGCWIEDSAFVMILPAATAEEARLLTTHTAEGLWDYQLRSLGSLPLIFHWGNAEAINDHLGEAVERAREQMLESGRARKQVLTASGRFRRRVVNG